MAADKMQHVVSKVVSCQAGAMRKQKNSLVTGTFTCKDRLTREAKLPGFGMTRRLPIHHPHGE